MPDQAPAAPTPAEVAENLTAAKQTGGMAWRQQAQRYVDAGVPLSSADRQLLASMNRTLPGTPVDDAMKLGGLSPADARNQIQGNKLLAAGRSLEQVREIIGDPTFEPDERSEAQRDFDKEHNIAPIIDQRAYAVSMPPSETAAAWAPVDAAVRSLASDLGYDRSAGSVFIGSVTAAASELAGAEDQGLTRQKWDSALAQVFPGAKLGEAEARVAEMLKLYAPSSELATKLKETGLLRNPTLFVRLHNRALALASWAKSRP